MALLTLKDATIKFGGLTAVNKVSFEIEKGDLFGLIGPNGAGKTTCFNLITGVYEPTGGNILFDGKRINGLPPNKIAKSGICRTFQNIRLFASLSALENVMVGAYLRHKTTVMGGFMLTPAVIKETAELRKKAMELLSVVNLTDVANSRACDLSYGKQRRLEIARAMATDPKLILLDEPAAGMNPQEKDELRDVVFTIRDDYEKTVLLIEHDMKFVMGLCEKIVVLDHGEEIAYGGPEAIRNDPKVIEAYLGEPV